MKSLLTAIAFLTRFPTGRWIVFDAAEVGRSAKWFPLIGILLGAIYSGAAVLLKAHLPLFVVGVVLVMLDALATGGLHLDGLADSADGFGGGKDREDILRIMRDHSIGSYGGTALAIVVALKMTAFAELLKQANWMAAVILTPALGRWSILLLTATLPYARSSRSVVETMDKRCLLWGTAILLAAVVACEALRAWIALAVVAAVTAAFGLYCRSRIAGVTGDTLGANLELCESAALITFLWIR